MNFESVKPNEVGMNSHSIMDFINLTESNKNINLKTFVLTKDDKIVTSLEKEPYRIDEQHLLFSMTKSFTSLAIGIAYDKGLIKLNDLVVDFFPNQLPKVKSKNLQEIRVVDLLSMTSGIHDNTYAELYPQQDWVKAFLAQKFLHKPGTYYRYSTHATHMLSVILQKVSNMSLHEFLDEHLFRPMDISKPNWEIAPDGYVAGGMGLSLSTEAILKIGILLLNKGMYNGRRLISEEYLSQATRAQVKKHSEIGRTDRFYSGQYYGYQFHIDYKGNFRMDGAFGQLCLVVPDKNTVVVATSTNSNIELLLKLIYEVLLEDDINKDNRDSMIDLDTITKRLSYYEPKYNQKITPSWIENFIGKKCILYPEINNIDLIQLIFNVNHLTIHTTKIDSENEEIIVKYSCINYGKTSFIKDIQYHHQSYTSNIKWISTNQFIVQVRYLESPYVTEYKISLNDKSCYLEYSINVSFTLKNYSCHGQIR